MLLTKIMLYVICRTGVNTLVLKSESLKLWVLKIANL